MQLVQLIARQPFGHVCQKTEIRFAVDNGVESWRPNARLVTAPSSTQNVSELHWDRELYRARGPEAERCPKIIWRASNRRRVAAASASTECNVAGFATLKVVASEIEC